MASSSPTSTPCHNPTHFHLGPTLKCPQGMTDLWVAVKAFGCSARYSLTTTQLVSHQTRTGGIFILLFTGRPMSWEPPLLAAEHPSLTSDAQFSDQFNQVFDNPVRDAVFAITSATYDRAAEERTITDWNFVP
ncbi:hypothetical protein DPEC_G00245660 [Dallia pectoralis]|uniref:Uncharacterized protein n=1 Tax=Dallia pectoralis TaxID=75939 RepID=A0ACC2FW23_DALPE|nr:hypothetical protein DPEC_G00245660 [Dallia pectoralis]